ncbi:MAG: hypothetical protein R2867_14550 [Caldilineaceae bacterium]
MPNSKILITCDGAWLRGKTVNLKDIADEAVKKAPQVETVIMYKRTEQDVQWQEGRDHLWQDRSPTPAPTVKRQ